MKKILSVIFIIIIVIAVIFIIDYEIKIVNEDKEIEKLQTVENSEDIDIKKAEQQQENNNKKVILSKFQKLYQENSDLAGWIKIEDSKINYPVMQNADDALFYEHRNWNKEYSISGLPFIDKRCVIENSNNLIIYGHRMKNGTMFSELGQYQNETFYKEHRIIKFDTLYEKREYKIIGVFLSKVYYDEEVPDDAFEFYNYTNLNSEEDFEKYIENVKENCLYDISENAEYGDELITLVTCNYHTNNGRLVVVAKKINV